MKPRSQAGYQDTYDDDLDQSVELLDVGRETVIVVSGESWTEESFAALRAAIRPEVLVIHLPPGDTLQALDPEQMLAAGWLQAAELSAIDDDPVGPSDRQGPEVGEEHLDDRSRC